MIVKMIRPAVVSGLLLVAAMPPASAEAAESAPGLTVYTNGLALVDGERTLPPSPSGVVRLDGIGAQMIADSVRVDMPGGPTLREIALDSDILTHQALLARHVGKMVTVVRTNPETGTEARSPAEVLSVRGGLVLRVDGKIETNFPGRIVFDDVPADLYAEPRLSLHFDAPIPAQTTARVSYLTGGFSWEAVYGLVLNGAHTEGVLDGWAKMTNTSGAAIVDADVALVAGDVAREKMPPPGRMLMRAEAMSAAAPVADVPPAALSAFHLYDLPGRITLHDNATRQVRLLRADKVASARVLEYRSGAPVFGIQRGMDAPRPVMQKISIVNGAASNLGVPLPAGTVRVFMRDDAGALRFIGEDRINNLPVGEKMVLNLGPAFDVTVARAQTDFRKVGDRTTETAFALTVRNGAAAPAAVRVVEEMPGDWQMLDESVAHVREGGAATWLVDVPAKGEAVLTYRVRVRR